MRLARSWGNYRCCTKGCNNSADQLLFIGNEQLELCENCLEKLNLILIDFSKSKKLDQVAFGYYWVCYNCDTDNIIPPEFDGVQAISCKSCGKDTLLDLSDFGKANVYDSLFKK